MARYLEVATEANGTARELLSLIAPENKPAAACLIARMMNWGLRCAPRAVQSTVRINAVKAAVRGLPVRCRLEERQGDYGGTYKALVTEPVTEPVDLPL